ncbi:MAG: nucleotidyltransferase [Clostridiales bacterium]|nr:nucleotidyltransferase [Clostridiales bacterium]
MLKDDFETFCSNIELDNLEEMKTTIKEITKKLNKHYYDIEDKEKHMYTVGSVGRGTAIKNTSDLDILFDLLSEVYTQYDNYENNGQSALLQDVKKVLLERYPNTKIKGDGQVVVISFNKYKVELVPGFKQNDERFKYPDSNDGGHWRYTDPLPEIEACKNSNDDTNGNFYNVCHMLRAWKNKKGFKFKGLLIDTLTNNFFQDNEDYKDASYSSYLELVKSIFEFLKNEDSDRSYWFAIGSNQQISNDDNGKFIKKAKKAYNKLKDVNENDENINEVLRGIFGNEFPKNEKS